MGRHCKGDCNSANGDWTWASNDIINSDGHIFFSHATFFILSGFTSRAVTSWTEIKRRVPRLLQIWCLAAIMIFLYELECVILQQTSFIQALHLSLLGIFWGSNIGSLVSPGVMWFLFVFAWAKFLFEVCQLIFKKNQFILGPLVLLSAYVAYLVSQHMWLPQAFDIVPIAILFMWFGYLLKRILHCLNNFSLGIIFIIAVLFWIFCIKHGLYLEMATRRYPLFFVSILEAVAGTIVCSIFSMVLSKIVFSNAFSFLGKHTLNIMCIHNLDLYKNWWAPMLSTSTPWLAAGIRLLEDLSILLLLFIGTKLFRRIKYKNQIL